MTDAAKGPPEVVRLRERIEKQGYPLLGLRLEFEYLLLTDLEKIFSLFESALVSVHAEGVRVGRYPGTEHANPTYFVLSITSGSPLEILGAIVFFTPLIEEYKGFLLSVASSVVGAFVKDFLDRLRSVVGAPKETRPSGPVTEIVEVLERDGRFRKADIAHEEFDPQTGGRIKRFTVHIER